MSKRLTWVRKSAGDYVSTDGEWRIRRVDGFLSGVHWNLRRNGEHVHTAWTMSNAKMAAGIVLDGKDPSLFYNWPEG